MRIADLYMGLQLRGIDKTLSGLKDTRTGILGIVDVARTMTRALGESIFAFQQISQQSNTVGKELRQFENLTGISADRLQRWQFLALKSGVAARQMTSDIKAVQGAISQMVLGKGRPEGLGALVNTVGFDVRRARDTEYVLNKLREYAQKTKGLPEANKILESFGLSADVIQALKSSTVDLEKVSLNHRYAPGEIKALNAMSIAWSRLGDKIEHAVGRMNVKFGPSLLKDITKLTDSVLRLVTAFAGLIEKFHILAGIGKATNFVAGVLDFAANSNKQTLGAITPSKPALSSFLGAGKTVNNQTTINIDGSGDPEETAKAVQKHLDRQNNNALRSLPQGAP